jgi:type IV secretory pathway VirB3-like protein
MATTSFLALLAFSAMVTLADWRRGWLLVVLCGILQDPARKMTAGQPVVMSLSVVAVYAVLVFSAREELIARAREVGQRFPQLSRSALVLGVALVVAAANGIVTFGIALWKVPVLSLVLYVLPGVAVLVGYAWLDDESRLEQLLRFYAVVTSVVMIGTILEYFEYQWNALGTVGIGMWYYRLLPGMEIRMLSGFYRAPDIMGWHAATLASIGIMMAIRRGTLIRAWPWMAVTAWGFVNCLISGRRKAIYMVATFAIAFLWRYGRRLRVAQAMTFILVAALLALVVQRVKEDKTASVYARGAGASGVEIIGRLEGGLTGTLKQNSVFGAGLGTATQGTQHLTQGQAFGWQEGGLGKLAIELGLPGLLAAALLGMTLLRLTLRISAHPDLPETSHVMRAGLFGLAAADFSTFLASAQAYSDPLLALFSAFTLGMLLGSAMLDERATRRAAAATLTAPALPAAATT